MNKLRSVFEELIGSYTNGTSLSIPLWLEIEKHYSGKKRYYHNLSHLENLYKQLSDAKENIKDWGTVLFSLFYHDVIYNVLKNDNEEKSAALAQQRMKELYIPQKIIDKCVLQILATKKHELYDDTDINHFTDADLSVLGLPWDIYRQYFENVRKEYSIYPDIIYKPGRKKVLKHFLEMESIYKTTYFFNKFEQQARANLAKELELLK